MAVAYYIEGEIGEIRFDANGVAFAIIPSADFKRRDGDREFALILNKEEKCESAKVVPMVEFSKKMFSVQSFYLKNNLVILKINRCVLRTEFLAEDLTSCAVKAQAVLVI